MAADLTFGVGVLFAQGVGRVLRLAPLRARFGLRLGCGGGRRLRRLDRAALCFDFAARGGKLALDRLEAAAFGEPARRSGPRMRGGGKAVPAPEIALARNEPLPGLEQGGEARPVGAGDDADLAEPARELGRRLHMAGERGRAVRQLRIGRIERRTGPAHRRGLIDRRVEVVAERGAERLLVALVDDERVHHRRPKILVLDREELADRLRLGLEPLHPALGGIERRPRGVESLPRAGVANFRRARRVLRFGERRLCGRQRFRRARRCPARRCRVAASPDSMLPSSAASRAARSRMIAQRRLQLIAARAQIGERAGQFGKGFLRGGERRVGRGVAAFDVGEPQGARLRFGLERLLLGVEARERRLGVGGKRALALEVGGELFEPPVELDDALLGASLLALERVARDNEALQRGGGLGLGLAQGRQAGGDLRLARGRLRLLAGARGDDAHGAVPQPLGLGDFRLGRAPAQMQQQRFVAAHLAGNVAVAHRLPRLGLERGDLRGELSDDVLDAQQVLLGRLEPQFRLVASGVQPGNAGRLFEHAPALVGPRLDDLADAALMHQRRRARAGRGVGEQRGDVAGAHLAAVDAEHRALLARDAARDLERVGIVERRRRLAVAIVDRDPDLGVIARRPAGIAGEDHVVHLGAAHRLVGGFAHHPAHGFDQIGFAAAVRPDHAGQSGLDLKVGGFDEGLEADQAQPRELHALYCVPSPLRRRQRESLRAHATRRVGGAASARRMNRRAC